MKYPTIFNSADIAVITKIDLSAAVGFDQVALLGNIQAVRPGIPAFAVSAKTGAGMEEYLDFLSEQATGARSAAVLLARTGAFGFFAEGVALSRFFCRRTSRSR